MPKLKLEMEKVMMHWIVKVGLVLTVFAVLGACGSSEETISDKWRQYCDASAAVDAANCPTDMDKSGLTMFCRLVASSFYDTPECRQKVDALIACNKNRQWECWDGGEVPMVVDPDPCAAQAAHFTLSNESPGSCVDPTKISSSGG